MANRIDRFIDIGERLIASGRTRLLVALTAVGGLAFFGYVDRSNALYYAGGIVIVAIVFIVAKTIGDVKEGPAPDGQCEKTDDKKEEKDAGEETRP